jgi:hypothetical protein
MGNQPCRHVMVIRTATLAEGDIWGMICERCGSGTLLDDATAAHLTGLVNEQLRLIDSIQVNRS